MRTDNRGTNKPNSAPIILSALVMPGAGQLMQKRFMPALIFAVLFLSCFGAVCVFGFKIIFTFYSLPMKDTSDTAPDLPLMKLVIFFIISLIIYFISLIDTYLACKRQGTEWARQFLPEIPGIPTNKTDLPT